MAGGPLEGLRVLDFTWVLAGPYCTRILADYGAEVIKVQSAVTDPSGESNLSGYFNTWNRNKRSVTLNLNRPRAQAVAKGLATLSDVVVENFSPRVMESWGLDYPVLAQANPSLVMMRMSGFGQTGPWRDYVAFGPTIQALAGLTYLTGFSGREPLGVGHSFSDHIAGLAAALAILSALEHRRGTGKGQNIDLSQLEATCPLLGPAFLDMAVNGRAQEPVGNAPMAQQAAPYGVYRCLGDDRWCAISVFSQEEWKAFCRAIGGPPWVNEPTFASPESRVKNALTLDKRVESWTKEHTPEEVMSILQEADVPAGIVQNAEDLIKEDPQLSYRGFYASLSHPQKGDTLFDTTPMIFSETPAQLRRAAPLMGEDNEYVLGDILGMSVEEIAQGKRDGDFI